MHHALSRAALELATWRAELGINQTDAAHRLDIDQGRYSQFERGIRRPGLKKAIAIQVNTGGRVTAAMWFEPAEAVLHGSAA